MYHDSNSHGWRPAGAMVLCHRGPCVRTHGRRAFERVPTSNIALQYTRPVLGCTVILGIDLRHSSGLSPKSVLPAPSCTRGGARITQPLCFDILARSFVRLKHSTLLLSTICALFRKNTGVGYPPIPKLSECVGYELHIGHYVAPRSKSGRLRRVFSSAISRRQRRISSWFPLSKISGTGQPRYSGGRV